MHFYGNTSKGQFHLIWSSTSVKGAPLQAVAVGDLDGPFAVGVFIAADNVDVRNFTTIRGFSVGVEVRGASVKITDMVVDSSDLYGFKIKNAKGINLMNVSVERLFHGVGVGVLDSSNITIENSEFCPASDDGRHAALSSECLKSNQIKGQGNRIKLNNGCQGFSWKACK